MGARRGLIKLTLLTRFVGNLPEILCTKFETAKLSTKRVTEFHERNFKFFSFLGGRGGPIKLTLLIEGLDNLTKKSKYKI